jgi:hypothetical protein
MVGSAMFVAPFLDLGLAFSPNYMIALHFDQNLEASSGCMVNHLLSFHNSAAFKTYYRVDLTEL